MVDAVVLKAKHGSRRVIGIEGQKSADWVLIDLGEVVVHIFQRDAREFYDLERLWKFDVERQEAI